MSSDTPETPRLIKKYSNRRLYDTHTSSHITLADIRELVLNQVPFQVVEVPSGDDITRTILLQIIQEAENAGEPILSSDMLKSIICAYGPMQAMFAGFLESNMATLLEIQQKAGNQSGEAWMQFMQGQMPAMQQLMSQYLEQSKSLYLNTQNMFGLFNPFNNKPKQD